MANKKKCSPEKIAKILRNIELNKARVPGKKMPGRNRESKSKLFIDGEKSWTFSIATKNTIERVERENLKLKKLETYLYVDNLALKEIKKTLF